MGFKIPAHVPAADCRILPLQNKREMANAPFEGTFQHKVQQVAADLKTFRLTDETGYLHQTELGQRIRVVLDEALKMKIFFSDEAQSLFTISDEIKKHNRHEHIIWESLTTEQKAFVQKLAPLTEAPGAEIEPEIFAPDFYNQKIDGVYNFGAGRLFKVTHVQKDQEHDCLVFPLTNHPGFAVYRPDVHVHFERETHLRNEAENEVFQEDGTVKNLGRMNELFKVKSKMDSSESKMQLMLMYRFYVQSIHESLGLPVVKSCAIDQKGKWEIRTRENPITFSNIDFKALSDAQIDQMAQDIFKHFQVEREWNLDILGTNVMTTFALHAGKVVLHHWPVMPKLLTEDVKVRHEKFFAQLAHHPQIHEKVLALYNKNNQWLSVEGKENKTSLVDLTFKIFKGIPEYLPIEEKSFDTHIQAQIIVDSQIAVEIAFKDKFFDLLQSYIYSLSFPTTESLVEIAQKMIDELFKANNFNNYFIKADGFKHIKEHFMLRVGNAILDELDGSALKCPHLLPFLQIASKFKIDIADILHNRLVAYTKAQMPALLQNAIKV